MLGKRLIVVLMILMLLVGCGSNPTRDDGPPGPQGAPQSSAGPDAQAGDSSSDTGAKMSYHGGGGGNFNIPGNGDALLVIVGIIVVLVAAEAVVWTVDYIKQHSNRSLTGAVKDGIYYTKDESFSVAVPGDYPAHEGSGFTVHELRDQSQEQVVFLPVKNGEPLYDASMQPQLSANDAVMPLDDYADKLYPAPASSDLTVLGKPLQPVLDEKLTLDGKPALFREYIQQGTRGSAPVYCLLYFIRTTARGALVSITWTKDCPKCATGPEAEIRAMDPHLQQFVESFHMEKRP